MVQKLILNAQAFAIKVKVGDCGDSSDFGYLSEHINIFAPNPDKYLDDYVNNQKKFVREYTDDTISRCRMVQANTALIWFMFGCFVVTLVLSFTNKTTKRGGAMV